MSYARFNCDGSDVYVYEHYAGVIECCMCRLLEAEEERTGKEHPTGNYQTPSRAEMLHHLHRHQTVGHHVPKHTLAELRREMHEGGDTIMDRSIRPVVGERFCSPRGTVYRITSFDEAGKALVVNETTGEPDTAVWELMVSGNGWRPLGLQAPETK